MHTLLSSWPVCAVSCVLLWFIRSRPRSVGFVSMVHLVSSIRSGLLWHYSQAVHLLWFGRSLHPSHEAGLPPSPRLTGCLLRMRRGQPALGRHRPVPILVEIFGRCCRVSRLICQRVSQSPPGGSPGGARRVSCAGWHSWPGRLVLTSMGAPPTAVGRVSSPRGFAHGLVPRENPTGFFINNIYKYIGMGIPVMQYQNHSAHKCIQIHIFIFILYMRWKT